MATSNDHLRRVVHRASSGRTVITPVWTIRELNTGKRTGCHCRGYRSHQPNCGGRSPRGQDASNSIRRTGPHCRMLKTRELFSPVSTRRRGRRRVVRAHATGDRSAHTPPVPENPAHQHLRVVIGHHDHLFRIGQVDPDDRRCQPAPAAADGQAGVGLRSRRDTPLPSPMNVLLLRFGHQARPRIRRSFPRPDRHAEHLSMPPSMHAGLRCDGADQPWEHGVGADWWQNYPPVPDLRGGLPARFSNLQVSESLPV